jgi:hypothetical protein
MTRVKAGHVDQRQWKEMRMAVRHDRGHCDSQKRKEGDQGIMGAEFGKASDRQV